MKPAVTHIALYVEDVHRSAAFYRQWCEMDVVHTHDSDIENQPVTWLACEGQEDCFVIVLIPGRPEAWKRQPGGMTHIGFNLDSQEKIKEMAQNAQASGVLHWDYDEHDYPVGTVCSLVDPDGHIIEFSHGQPLGADFKARQKGQKKKQQHPKPPGLS